MFQETNESKSDSDRLLQPSNEATSSTTTTTGVSNPASKVSNHPHKQNHSSHEMQNKTTYSVNEQQMAATALHQHYLNYFNSNIPREESRFQRTRGNIPNSQDHSAPASNLITNQRIDHNTNRTGNINNNSAHVYHIPSQIHNHHPSSHQMNQQAHQNNMPRSVPRDESPMIQKFQQQQQHPQDTQHAHIKSRMQSTGTPYPISQQAQQMTFRTVAHNNRQEQVQFQNHHQHQLQQDRDSEETTTIIKKELENDLQGCKTSELEAISSLERNLPIELSFLIRQQAHCMARMNYLDRQIREMKDAAQTQQQVEPNHVSSTSILNQGQSQRPASNIVYPATTMTHARNGNFILSDDSGGEYSRATISDDDELSSLLDQIARSVRPERGGASGTATNSYSYPQQQQQQQQQQQHQQQRLAANCGTLMGNQQPYSIINPNQLHHQQAVPIFVMGSPIAVAHPSSINSSILPGVHFQPEPRYNQYYEDFYYGNNVNNGLASSMVTTPMPAMQRHGQSQHQNRHRLHQFDSSISVIEQLVSQKEKRQIISQLKSADNWLKMRSANQDSSMRIGSKQQQSAMTKQMSAEAVLHEEETQAGDNKAAMTATPSTSAMQVGGDRVIVDQVDE